MNHPKRILNGSELDEVASSSSLKRLPNGHSHNNNNIVQLKPIELVNGHQSKISDLNS